MIHDSTANERNFIGALLRSPHDYWQCNDTVSSDMMSVPHHRTIFEAVRDLSERGKQVTITALQANLPEEFDDIGPAIGVLMALKESAAEAGSATDYAPFLAERSALKRLDALSEWLRKETRKNERPAEDVAAEAGVRLQAIMAVSSPVKPVKLSEVTKGVVTASGKARDSDRLPGFTTGLTTLDEMTGLLMGGDFIAIMASIGEGKSALMAQIGKHIAKTGPVLSAHNEMSAEQNGTRALSGESGMTVREIREGAYDFTGYESVVAAQKEIEKLQYYLYTNPKMTVRSIKVRALQMQRTVGLSAITVDGAKRLRTETKHRDPWERKEEITGSLKELAIELNVPVIVAFQRTRMGRRRDDAIPQLDDAQFPALEEDADIIIGAWREESFLMMNKPNAKAGGEAWEEWEHKIRRAKGAAKMIALKIRSGTPFEQREFKWRGEVTRFEDL